MFQHHAQHVFHPLTGKKETIESLLNGPMKEVWERAVSNKFGRLVQGNVHGVTSIDTIDFIPQSMVPTSAAVTYASTNKV